MIDLSATTKEENIEANIGMLFRLISQKDTEISELKRKITEIETIITNHVLKLHIYIKKEER